MKAEGRVAPQRLPRRVSAPIAFHGSARIATTDGSHPSALRETIVSIDRGIAVDAEGLPVCGYRQIATRDSEDARRICRKALVGSGEAVILLSYPENRPLPLLTEISLFNGGARGNATMLFVHGYIPRSVAGAGAIVARVEMTKALDDRYGSIARIEIPRMSGGHGSLIEIDLRMRRTYLIERKMKSYLSARCPHGSLWLATEKAVFRNELQTPGVPAQTSMKGRFEIPCTPKR
ncbi:MAG TPA: hypothetical protein VFU04_02200 [Solirubrobacterales bacterium]|nr:hypothetical protein [Solirubrobacterales bacterium]